VRIFELNEVLGLDEFLIPVLFLFVRKLIIEDRGRIESTWILKEIRALLAEPAYQGRFPSLFQPARFPKTAFCGEFQCPALERVVYGSKSGCYRSVRKGILHELKVWLARPPHVVQLFLLAQSFRCWWA
jgi:hypothetical protein